MSLLADHILSSNSNLDEILLDYGVTRSKISTIEASGIGIACIAAQYFHVPVVFAKKTQSINLGR